MMFVAGEGVISDGVIGEGGVLGTASFNFASAMPKDLLVIEGTEGKIIFYASPATSSHCLYTISKVHSSCRSPFTVVTFHVVHFIANFLTWDPHSP